MPQLAKNVAEQAEKNAWDPDELPEFSVLEDGDYVFQLIECTSSDNPGKSGYHYWRWVFEHPGDKTRVWENTSLSPNSLGKIGQIMAAFEVPADTDTALILGWYVGVTVEKVVQEVGKNKGKFVNNALAFFPASECDEYDPDEHDNHAAAGGGRSAAPEDFGGDDEPEPEASKPKGGRRKPPPAEEPF
jgi:hypothetical protein